MKKKNISKLAFPLIAFGFSFLFLVLLNLTYCASATGIQLLDVYQTGFLGFVIAFFQFFYIIGLLLLINISFLGFLKEYGVVEIKKSYKDWTYKKLVKTLIMAITMLSLVTLLFVIIFCIKYSIYIGFGIIMNTVLAIIGCVLVWVLDKKQNDGKASDKETGSGSNDITITGATGTEEEKLENLSLDEEEKLSNLEKENSLEKDNSHEEENEKTLGE